MILTFNDFIKKTKLENEATSNTKIQQLLSSIRLDKVGIFLRDGSFSSDIGIVNLHPLKGSHWVCCIEDCYFDSYGCPPSTKIVKNLKS